MAVGESLFFDTSNGLLIPYPLAEAWDGTAWTVVPTPVLTNSAGTLDGVSCTSASSCIAVGNYGPTAAPTDFTLAEEWDGLAWDVLTMPPPPTPGGIALQQISCLSSASCMAVGYFGYNNGTGTSLTLAEAWANGHWKIVPTPTPQGSGQLAGVSCLGTAACMAVGENNHPVGEPVRGTLTEAWNGTRWSAVPSPNPRGSGAAALGSVSCTGLASCMSTGSANDMTGEYEITLAEAWDGSAWTILRTPSPGSFADELRGVSCTTSLSCMAVGDYVGIGDEFTLAERWDGSVWKLVPTPRP